MPVSLKKGEKVSLTKTAGPAGLLKIKVGLGWDARVTDGKPFDADASAFLLTDSGKTKDEGGFVFYGNKKSPAALSSTPATTPRAPVTVTTRRSRSISRRSPRTSRRSPSRSPSTKPKSGASRSARSPMRSCAS